MVTLFGHSLSYQGDWVGLQNFQLVLSDPLFTTGIWHNFLLLLAVPVVTVAALLVAPMSGHELQAQTRDQFDHLVDDARHAAETKRVQLEAQLEALKAPKPAEKPTGA